MRPWAFIAALFCLGAWDADNTWALDVPADTAPFLAPGERSGLRATWAVNPSRPGPDLPPVGRSLFDVLFVRSDKGSGSYRIPFPFTELVKTLRDGENGVGRSGIKQVLIPLGRSLQRHAAAPDYFEYPRIVLAVDGESNEPGALPLKDRFFLGYQEKANIIEAISYNEAAGRFEFQVVRNYGPDLQSQVFYARRVICLSCHQNGGPIFSRAAWSETPANPKVASRMLDLYRSYSGVVVNQSANTPFAIDEATDRASLLPAYQLLWAKGCGDNFVSARRCRAAAFTAALQYRLTSRQQYETESTQYKAHFLKVFHENWQQRWPDGIMVPTADIPNRDPVASAGRISAQLDPLTPRAPLEYWFAQRPDDLARMILGISEFLTVAAVRYLDNYLFDLAQTNIGDVELFRSECKFDTELLSGAASRISFACDGSTGNGFRMGGRLYVDADKVTDGVIDELEVAGASLKRLEFPVRAISSEAGYRHLRLPLFQRRTKLHARLPSGNALQAVEFRWAEQRAQATLLVLHDFAPVHNAVAKIVDDPEQDVFMHGPFRERSIMAALYKQLKAPYTLTQCCAADFMPMPEIDSDPLLATATDFRALNGEPDAHIFFRYCASCHQSQAPFPPNFLYGNKHQITANLAQCAQRIGYRLQMWQLPEVHRLKSPMPPVTAIHSLGLSEEAWRANHALLLMQNYVTGLLESHDISYPGLLKRDYTTLPECLVQHL